MTTDMKAVEAPPMYRNVMSFSVCQMRRRALTRKACVWGRVHVYADPPTEGLVVGARAEPRERARLTVDLNRAALGLILERRDHVTLAGALELKPRRAAT
jgi:hypothetical protein